MSNPILVEVTRGGVLESFHRGVICIVDKDDKVVFEKGDIKQLCYPRSALKFFQQIPLMISGAVEHFGFTEKEIALFCGSHNGEAAHVETVRSILDKIGLDETYLQCGPQMPTLRDDQYALIKSDLPPLRIHNNCSGKHAGFLAYCVYKNYSTTDYIDPNHPLHLEILDVISDFHRYPKDKIKQGIDGCSAPIFAFPVYNQAVAYKNLICPESFGSEIAKACNTLVDAIVNYPEMIAGRKRYCTDLMRFSEGKLIGKTGADGIYSLGIRSKNLGVCIKVDDGKMGPQYNIAQSVVEQLGIFDEASNKQLRHYVNHENKNFGGLVTGETHVSAEVKLVLNNQA
ncbi:MAG TPA: asparaginase [Bacteroidia bacterium]